MNPVSFLEGLLSKAVAAIIEDSTLEGEKSQKQSARNCTTETSGGQSREGRGKEKSTGGKGGVRLGEERKNAHVN